ncbi:VOC family protein [Sphingomonas sp. SRS2]|uniref:VOC family protein n=1 Tax=Sphingomonas sp. SRS2 TaxID=133190 RepID=UPI00061840AD|nr:VOC family protein [Sphingomonas sp. SRS2]KKC26498.1 glyoxalase [Sphingomonas sp. SRS2]
MGVIGIGGLFFRAKDPDALNVWYRDHLGVGAGCNATGEGEPSEWYWLVQGGPVVFAPFKDNTDYFPADKQYMINLRVSGIDDLLASLRAGGIAVETRAEWDAPETGRFARIHDPEGNAIELWEPPASS